MHNTDLLNTVLIDNDSLIVSWLRRSNTNNIEGKIHKSFNTNKYKLKTFE